MRGCTRPTTLVSGEQAFQCIGKIRPDAKIILTSGYRELDATEPFKGKGLAGFIQKPYTTIHLIKKVESFLNPKP